MRYISQKAHAFTLTCKVTKVECKKQAYPQTCLGRGRNRGRNKACFGADKVVPAPKPSVNLAWSMPRRPNFNGAQRS